MTLLLLIVPIAWLLVALFGLTLLRLAARSDGADSQAWAEWASTSELESAPERQGPPTEHARQRRRATG